MDCTRIIVTWCKHYRLKPGLVSFAGYTNELPDDIGGRCYYNLSSTGKKSATIYIPNKL